MARRNSKFHTMQPDGRHMKVWNYLKSMENSQANYENVPSTIEQTVDRQVFVAHQDHHHHHHHHHPNHHQQQQQANHHYRQASINRHAHNQFHSRSQSQHHHNSMAEYNNYYNLPHIDEPFPRINQSANRSVRPQSPPPSPQLIIHQPVAHQQQKHAQLDSMTVMRVGAELGVNIDAAPEMPPSRNYSILTKNGHLYKIPFPQNRTMATDVSDAKVYIGKNEPVVVLGPSSEDRSKFIICYKDSHIEVPHQQTRRPQLFI